jgi:hypothetical protein
MEDKLARFLDYCLERIKNGETIEQCLAEYPALRHQMEPLLRSALAVSSLPKVAVSEQYRETALGRMMARLHQETGCNKVVELDQQTSFKDNFTRVGQWLQRYVIGAKRLAIPVALAVIIAIGASVSASSWVSPSSALASRCTLSILSGNVEILIPGQEGSQSGADGMTLDVGTRIITAPDTEALITFFDGSTLNLEPQTDIEIQRLVSDDEQNISIVLKQWMGKTWSRVVKMADPHYEIHTPSATAIVRGTTFMVEVDETGETIVVTDEGLVSVIGEDAEVFVPAGWETKVKRGATPAFPFNTPPNRADHQLPENAVAPPFNGGLPDNAMAPPFNGELPDNAAAPARGELPDNAAAPARGEPPDNAAAPASGELPDNAAAPASGELPDNAAAPASGELPDNAAAPASGALPGNAAPPAGGAPPGNAAPPAQGTPPGHGGVPPGLQ